MLVQPPPSIGCTDEHASNMRELLGDVDRDGFEVAWEPRGDWPDHPDHVASLCEALDLVHVVDPMRAEPVADHDVAYLRLHGLNDDPYDYDYRDAELDELAERLEALAGSYDRVYCLFNDYEMYGNARALGSRIEG